MRKIVGYFLIIAVAMSLFVFSSAAANGETMGGYVEFDIEASPNFDAVITVYFVDINTGDNYMHDLYRINEYEENFEIPFGVYRVYAVADDENEESAMVYKVSCPEGVVAITEADVAVTVPLSVEVFDAIDLEPSENWEDSVVDFFEDPIDEQEGSGDSDTSEDNSETEVYPGVVLGGDEEDTELDDESAFETTGKESSDVENDETAEEGKSGDEVEKKDNSLLVSTLIYGGILILMCIGYIIYKKKS